MFLPQKKFYTGSLIILNDYTIYVPVCFHDITSSDDYNVICIYVYLFFFFLNTSYICCTPTNAIAVVFCVCYYANLKHTIVITY